MAYGGIQRYRQSNVNTASSGILLIQLYDAALKYARKARACIVEKNPAGKGLAIGKSIDIIHEFRGSLKHDKAPDLCANLDSLYDYLIRQLQAGSVTLKVEPIDEVIAHLQALRTTWADAVAAADRAKVGGSEPQAHRG